MIELTEQQAFDIVSVHLLQQNARSCLLTPNGEHCLYRGPEGRKCAVGILIPDEAYNPEWDHYIPFRGLYDTEVLDSEGDSPSAEGLVRASVFPEHLTTLLMDLQKIHDQAEPRDWRRQLEIVAGEHKLNTAAMDLTFSGRITK